MRGLDSTQLANDWWFSGELRTHGVDGSPSYVVYDCGYPRF